MVAILLATYNSGRFLEEQLDSILIQTYKDWVVYVHDDGSTDNTISIVDSYIRKYPEHFRYSNNQVHGLRAYKSFLSLLGDAESDYYMFCDHDDVWVHNKIELSMNRMQELEKKHKNKPIVVHTDMKVVDQNLNVMSNSFWSYSKYLPDHVLFEELVCCNCVNGCTMLFNNAAKIVAKGNEEYCLMHDTYVSQSVASVNGIISAIKRPTVLYRQHFDNVIGAADRNKLFFIKRMLVQSSNAISVNYEVWKRISGMRKISFITFLYYKLKITLLRYLL